MKRRSFFLKLFGGIAAGVGAALWRPKALPVPLPEYHSIRALGFKRYKERWEFDTQLYERMLAYRRVQLEDPLRDIRLAGDLRLAQRRVT